MSGGDESWAATHERAVWQPLRAVSTDARKWTLTPPPVRSMLNGIWRVHEASWVDVGHHEPGGAYGAGFGGGGEGEGGGGENEHGVGGGGEGEGGGMAVHGGGGDGEGGGGIQRPSVFERGPQSKQSVPRLQMAYSEPGPPSSQSLSEA